MEIHPGKKLKNSEWIKCPGKKRYTFQKKFRTLLKKLNGETSIQNGEISIHFCWKTFCRSKKKRSLSSKIEEKMFFFERKLFFNIFCLRDREKNGDFSSLPLSKDFWRLLFIFICHISAFYFFETMIHCFSIQNREISILNGDFSIQTLSEAFRTFFVKCACLFFQCIFSIRNGEISIQNGDFSIQTFSDALWIFFEICLSFFFQSIFSIQNGEFSF